MTDCFSRLHKIHIFDKPHYITKEEADFLEKVLELKTKNCVLDAGCGTGRLSVELSKRGYNLYGLDISSQAIEYARNISLRENQNIVWICDDAKNINYKDYFDGVFYWGGQFFSPFDCSNGIKDKLLFDKIFLSLKKGGKFLLAIQPMESLIPVVLTTSSWSKLNQILILSYTYYDINRTILTMELTIIEKYKLLSGGGRSFFNLSTLEVAIKNILRRINTFELLRRNFFRKKIWIKEGNDFVLFCITFNIILRKITMTSFKVSPQKVFKTTSSCRLYTFRELIEMAKSSGFFVKGTYGSINFAPFDIHSPVLYLLLMKP